MKSCKYDVKGMSCASCSSHVDNAVSKLNGVEEVSVNLLTNSMNVVFDEKVVSSEDICEAVSRAGYKASEQLDKDNKVEDKETKKSIVRLILSTILLLLLMYVTMGCMMWGWPLPSFIDNPVFIIIFEFTLTLIIMIINYKYFVSGVKSILHLSPNMDALVSLGSFVSFAYSVVLSIQALILNANGDIHGAHEIIHNLYFESAAMILTLITIGKTLESFSKGKTTNAIKGLMDLSPKNTCVIVDGKEMIIPSKDVKVDDIFVVRPGELISVDGIIIEGSSSFDESSITGESVLVEKKIGDSVIGGTINQVGYIKCKATKVGKDTTLSQIIALVEEANATKAPISKIADTISKYFVPSVILISLITLIVWMIISKDFGKSLNYAICVLVISCPCALGLATPVAIMVGSGVGARNGILFKTASSLEETGKVKIVVLDKTGTITEGVPHVKEVVLFNDYSESELLSFLGSLENTSEHPLAKSIVSYTIEKGYSIKPCSMIDVSVGYGIKGIVEEKEVVVGNAKYIQKFVPLDDYQNKIDELSDEGVTPLIVIINRVVAGIITLEDKVKKDSVQAIDLMKKLGLEVIMLTGDNIITARRIASNVGLENKVIANVLPGEKEKVVRELQKYGKVMMVGDGINDAPSLTRADIGVALGKGNDIAKNASEVVLMKSSLMGVYKAINLSSKTFINIKENLFWAFIYNIICIPLAFGAFASLNVSLTPMYGALAMSFSSIFVVINALRLNLCNISKGHINKKNLAINVSEIKIKEETITKEFLISNMMCMHCVKRVENAISKVDGVSKVNVSLETKKAVVEFVKLDVDAIKKSVTEAGYNVVEIEK